MVTVKPSDTMKAFVTHTLAPDRSFDLEAEMNDMEGMELRARKLMCDKEIISNLLPVLNEYAHMKRKLALCLNLLLDSANIAMDVKSNIQNGKLLKAYKNFIKFEKCRNDLLELIDDNDDEQQFVIEHFADVELMAGQIYDVIHLTLCGTVTSTGRNSNDDVDSNNDISTADNVDFHGRSDEVLQQIMQIIEYEMMLDSDDEMRKQKGLKGLLNRPRNWRNRCMTALNERVQKNFDGPFGTFLEQLFNSSVEIGEIGTKDLGIEQDAAYREELLAMKKYLKETRLREDEFREALARFLQNENVFKQADDYITSGNLLVATEKLLKAESIRYHLLALAKSHNDYATIYKLLTSHYEPLGQIYERFKNEAKYYCTRGIDIMRGKDPETKKQLEIVLRAIEIDEKVDKLYEINQFKIENRPHNWRKTLFKIIEERVQQRVEAFQIEDRKLNKNWVIRNLEICRLYIVEDLYAAKQFLCIFPKEHQLYNNFVMFYHIGIADKISEMAKGELNKRELIQLLGWIRQYPGEHMLGMAFLEIDAVALIQDKPLLEQSELLRLFSMFVEIMQLETAEWALKTVKQEFANIEELAKNIMEDEYGYYYTHLPHILYSIVNDQITLAYEISNEIVPKVLNVCLYEYIKLIFPRLKDSIMVLKNKELDPKEHTEEYTKLLVAIANNLDMCAESTEKLRRYIEGIVITTDKVRSRRQSSLGSGGDVTSRQGHFNQKIQVAICGAMSALTDIPAMLANAAPLSSEIGVNKFADVSKRLGGEGSETDVEIELEDEEPLDAAWERIEILKMQFNNVLHMVMDMLRSEVYSDLSNSFDLLLSKQWVKDPSIVGTICETVTDYEEDYKHLRPQLHAELLQCIEFKIVEEYLNAIASRKLTCTEFRKRLAMAKCLEDDAGKLNKTFQPLLSQFDRTFNNEGSLTNLLLSIAEFIKLRDKDMLPLEVASLLRKYPEMTQEFLFSIIDIRDDMTSSESRVLAEECLKMSDEKQSDPILAQLFQMAKGERKTSQIIKDMVPRLRRRVRVSIANQ